MMIAIDHVALLVRDLAASVQFYEEVLNIPVICYGHDRYELQIGSQRVLLRPTENSLRPTPRNPLPGSVDLCLLADVPMAIIIANMASFGIRILLGPCLRKGGAGPMNSICIHDPDGNLLEITTVA